MYHVISQSKFTNRILNNIQTLTKIGKAHQLGREWSLVWVLIG